MLHFDSHSDLSIPRSSCNDWYDKSTLLDLLQLEGGISEFLIPLLYVDQLSSVIWIRPEWSKDEFGIDADYSFCVGDDEANNIAKSSLKSLYYIDDDVFCEQENMLPSSIKTCCVKIITVTSTVESVPISCHHNIDKASSLEQEGQHWVLDICLDYFGVCNPFLKDIRDHLAADFTTLGSIVDGMTISQCIDLLIKALRLLRFRQCNTIHSLSSHSISNLKTQVLQSLASIFLYDYVSQSSATAYTYNDVIYSDDLKQLINICFATEESNLLVYQFIKLMSQLSLITRQLINKYANLVFLPESSGDKELNQTFTSNFVNDVKKYQPFPCPPSAITIAMSVDDGYTPRDSSKQLLDQILMSIRLHLIPFWQSRSEDFIVHDLSKSEDAVSDAYALFLNKTCRQYIE